jgi:hypothetical protein
MFKNNAMQNNLFSVEEGLVMLGQDRQSSLRINVTLRRVRVTTVAVEIPVSITHSECVFAAVVNQHAKRVRRIILSSVACLAVPYFSTLFS